MRLARALVLVLLTPLAAGCIGGTEGPDDEEPGTDAMALADPLAALDAGDPFANVHVLGDWRDGGTQEAHPWRDLLFVVRTDHVVILNVSDPADIREVGQTPVQARVQDVKSSDDGRYLFVADQLQASAPPKGGVGPLTGGLYTYDISDPAAPALVHYLGIGDRRGPHMVHYFRYPDGSEYVFAANADVSINRFDRAAASLETVARYSPDLLLDFDRSPERFDVLYGVQGWAHDMFVQAEPDGTVLMYVANWDAGLRIVDVTDPARPQEVGRWLDYGEGEEGNLHTVVTDWIGDRRITIGTVEIGFAVVGGLHYAMATDKPVMYVWDTTDPADIQLITTWVNPIKPYAGRDVVPGEAVDSIHNFQLEDGRVYLAHYALGMFVLDVSTPERQAAPEVLAYYQDTTQGRSTWDVVVSQGVIFTSGVEGVVGLHFLPDVRGPLGITGRA